MPIDLNKTRSLVLRDTLHPRRVQLLRRIDFVAVSLGMAAVLLNNGIRESRFFHPPWELGALAVLAMGCLVVTTLGRYRWSLTRSTLLKERRAAFVISGLWLLGFLSVVILGPVLPEWSSRLATRWEGFVILSELGLVARAIAELLRFLRGATAGAFNPGWILVASFLGLIVVGTALLMLPRARVKSELGPAESAPFVTALFTSVSATCVTGLVVEDTPTYWSREGQCVILCLFQIGGLGIMTFGAFFGLIAGRGLQVREHSTLGSLLESEGLGDVRRLLLAILGFTLLTEGLGVLFLSTLWPDLPWGERLFFSLFHSVSAFCNAGFALTPNSFVGMSHQWQVWGVLSGLIVIGGLGFAVLGELSRSGLRLYRTRQRKPSLLPDRPPIRMALTSRLVLITSGLLLVGGTIALYLMERTVSQVSDTTMSLSDAWFQSVTFRTAGFNTVELGELHAATKLLAILLMFVGASPGSTGGGIKTVAFAVAILGMSSLLRGRVRIECFGRTLPSVLIQRVLAVMFLSVAAVMSATILLMIYEDRPEFFLDYLFESVSAVGTVGVSSSLPTDEGGMTSVTQSLSTPSRLVIIAAMFAGRVGPLTLLIAMGGRPTTARYHYPEERVALG